MAVLSLADFFDKLNILEYDIYLTDNGISSQTKSGQILRAVSGPRLWTGNIVCQTYKSYAEGRELEALCQHVQAVGNHFLVRDKKASYPASRVAGDVLSGVTITSPTAGFSATLTGLPAYFVLTGGDYFSYSVGGIHYMHRIALTATASAGGTVTVTLVNPLITGSLPANGAAITLVKPKLTSQIIPGSLQLGTVGLTTTSGLSFSWIQSIKI